MISEIFLRIMDEYPADSIKDIKENELANFIRHEFPETLRLALPEFSDYIWVASVGKGRWADAPWLAIFDSLVTDTAQKGYYPVYLFTKSLDSVYLSLNQGMTELREEYSSSQAREILAQRAEILRIRLHEFQSTFTADPLDLQHAGSQTRLSFYEPGHAFGIKYLKKQFPSDEKIISDLYEMLRLYRLATVRGGIEDFDTSHSVSEEQHAYEAHATLEEKRRLRYHYVIERNSKLAKEAKRAHGYVCQVCNFDFFKKYGELGRNYIEAHHKIPISKLPINQTVKLSPVDDFAVVCANCHRMIHRKGAPESFEEFQKLYNSLPKH